MCIFVEVVSHYDLMLSTSVTGFQKSLDRVVGGVSSRLDPFLSVDIRKMQKSSQVLKGALQS